MITSAGYNDIIDGILVGHGQDGVHKSGTVLTLPQINDTSSDHQYVLSVCELVADRTVALPLLTGNDEFTFNAHTQTLTNKTLTSPVINTEISGTAILDEDTMSSDSATKVPTQQSVKAYVDAKVAWFPSPDTWVYVSDSSFKIVGVDRTTTYTKGTRLKFTNSTLKYAVVASSSFSTDTTVNIIVNTDYVLANAAISSPYYSYQVCPQGYPTWFNITPTTSNVGGFSSIDGYLWKWRVEGASCTMTVEIRGTSNAANLTITAPVAVATQSSNPSFLVVVMDNGIYQASPGVLAVPTTGATLRIGKTIGSIAGGTYAGFTGSGNKGVDGTIVYQF